MALSRAYVGTNSIGASALALASDKMYVKKVSLTADTLLATIDAYLHTTDGEQVTVRPVVYTDNAGSPDLMLVGPQFAANSVEFNGTDRWVKLPVGLHIPASADYWIGVHAPDPGSLTIAYETTGGNDQQVDSGSTWTLEPGAVGGSIVDPGDHLYSIRASMVSTIDASFVGRTTVGASDQTLTTSTAYLKKVTIPAGGTLATVDAQLKVTVASVPSVVAVVMSDSSNAPDRFLHVGHGESDAWLLENTYRWFSFPIGLQFDSATDVWIGVMEDDAGTIALAFDATGGADGTLTSRSEAGTWTAGTQDYSIRGTVLDETLDADRFGASSFGASEQTPAASVMYAVPVTLPAEGLAVSIEAGIRDVTGTTDWTNNAALYEDDGGQPGNLIASVGVSNAVMGFITSEADRWYGFPIFEFLPAGDYWIGFQNGLGEGALLYDTGSLGDGYEIDALTTNVIPEPGSSGTTLNDTDQQYSLRLVVLSEAGIQNLSGTLFTKAPTFFQGVITGGVQTLAGVLFTKAPSFKLGTLSSGAVLTGTLFTKAPSFFTGTLGGGTSNLQGTLFTKAPTFFAGSVAGGAQALTGNPFQINPDFFSGSVFAAGAGGTAQSAIDEGLRFEVWTLPQLGTFTRKYDLTRWVNSFSISDKFTEISDGTLQIAESLPADKLNQLITVDRTNHANDEGSVIRVLRGTTPIMHYITKQYDDTWSSDDPTANLKLEGLELLLDRAIVPRKDYPTVPSVEPDWIYGAKSLLGNSEFDNPAVTSSVVTLEINATAGTFKIQTSYPNGDPFVSTANIPYNATAQNIADAIEAAGDIADVLVTGAGTTSNPFVIEVLDPAAADITWATDSGLLTGLASIGTLTAGGNLADAPWTESTNPISGILHGSYTEFEISTEQFHSAPNSLKVDGDPPLTAGAFPGAQQLLSVTGGRTYRAYVWVYPTQTGPFRFVIRTRDETFIAQNEQTLTAGVWTQMSIPSVTVPLHVSQIIFRIATISSGDEPAWYVDDALFAPGAEAATYGAIMSDVTDPIIANGVLTWLTRTWTDTHDSAGLAWDRDLEWAIKRGQTILQLMEYARKWNYEWRIRWSVANSRFEWDLFNPTSGGTNYTGTGLGITGRSGVTSSGVIARRFPEASYYQAEGDLGQWGENEDATMSGAWGRLEQYFANAQGLDAEGLTELADRLVDDSVNRVDGLSVRLQVPTALPWSKFQPGDILKVNLSPQRDGEHLRCVAVVASQGPNDAAPAYDVHFGSVVYQGEASVLQAVRVLWREFKALQSTPQSRDTIVNPVIPTEPPQPAGGFYITIAAANSRPDLLATADFPCDGSDDNVEWQAAIDFVKTHGGGIIAWPGDYTFTDSVGLVQISGSIHFLGHGAVIHATSTIPTVDGGKFLFEEITRDTTLAHVPSVVFDGLIFDGDNVTLSGGMRTTDGEKPHVVVRKCVFQDFDLQFIYAEQALGERFDILMNTFQASVIEGGTLQSPSLAGIMFSGDHGWAAKVIGNSFKDITIPSYYGATVDLGSTLGGVIADNTATNCTRDGGGGFVFTRAGTTDGVHDNWINGTWTP